MKRKLAKMLIIAEIIIICITSCCINVSYAAGETNSSTPEEAAGNTSYDDIKNKIHDEGAESVDNMANKGEAKVESAGGTRTEMLAETASSSDTIAGVLCSMFVIIPSVANNFMTILVKGFQITKITLNIVNNSGEIVSSEREIGDYFLIEDLVMNRYDLFNINYLDLSSASTNSTIGELRKNVAVWYYSIRNIAIVANCLILVYIGIRMAISTVVSDRVKYKKMFINWVTSVVLIFVMHYIIAIMFVIQEFFTDLIGNLFVGQGFEEAIMKDTFKAVRTARGWDAVGYTVTIYVLVYYQIKFFLMYFKRSLAVGFLFEISPLITITYAIDAVKDGKSQVYNRWFREMIFNIFIQLMHAVIYGVFILSAGEIAKQAPLMGAVLLMALSRAEKVIEKTFKLSSRITKSESIFQKFKQFGIGRKWGI